MRPSYRVFGSTEVTQLPGSEAERWSQGRKRNIIHFDRMVIILPIVGIGEQFPNLYLRRRD